MSVELEVSGFGWSISCYCIIRHILSMTSLKSLGSSTVVLNNKELQISMTYIIKPQFWGFGSAVAGLMWPGFGWVALLQVLGPAGTTLLQAVASWSSSLFHQPFIPQASSEGLELYGL